VAGPGRLDVLAGGEIDLGTSAGILSVGDLSNAALPDAGADLSVIAGLGHGGMALEAFAERYLAAGKEYAGELKTYLATRKFDPSLTAIENFKRLAEGDRRRLIVDVFFQELRAAGVAATGGDSSKFAPGFEAIGTLFPGRDYGSDLSLLLSRISTLDGGDVNLLVPGGSINAGVATASALIKPASELGIVVQRDGDINGFVDGDFIVNQSRVFALDGGDITIWSSRGDIDAGRGAKTALSVPPPTVSFDQFGNAVVEFPPAIAGSGIRGAVSTPGRPPGDVFLFAPVGIVDAGDAGIVSSGNITIAATAVLGAENISVGGVATGVPVATTVSLAAGLTGVSGAASSATKNATQSATEALTDKEQGTKTQGESVSIISVEVIGFGG
jgi:hypothetical protein